MGAALKVMPRVVEAGPVPVWDPALRGPLPRALRGGVVMLGNFDGFHRGHKALAACAKALAAPGKPVVMMRCDPHPRLFFGRGEDGFLITPECPPAAILREAQVGLVYAPRFNAEFAAQTPGDFVRDCVAGTLGALQVVVGADFRFGRGREGDVDGLTRLCDAAGIAVHVIDAVADPVTGPISSTRIREAIRWGRFDEAARLLGHDWISPVHQTGIGWGFPQAMVLPPDGTYAVQCIDCEGLPMGAGRVQLAGGDPVLALLPPGTKAIRWSGLNIGRAPH